ncbi:hypothetical protein SDC9_108757 [bioreactor metagenome]|uniref:Uncharacterized protein n=1 Tax=bioreactor metagenome TaxID=1076179 RepID=A0A645BFD7_9ZZZZ
MDPSQELNEILIAAMTLAFSDDFLDKIASEAFDPAQAELDRLLLQRKFPIACIDVRIGNGDVAPLQFDEIFLHLIRVLVDGIQQSSEKRFRVMRLHVGKLVGYERISDRVRTVETVIGEPLDVIIHLLGRLLGIALPQRPFNKVFSFFIDSRLLFFAYRSSEDVRFPQAEASHFGRHLHNLFLINHHPVGHLKDGFQIWMEIIDCGQSFFPRNEEVDLFHRTRSIKRIDGGDIFDRFRPEFSQHILYAGGFELEYPIRIRSSEYIERPIIIHRYFPNVDVFFVRIAGQLHRIIQYRQIFQTQEIHFEQADFFDVTHCVLRQIQLTVFLLQRHNIPQWIVADDDPCRVSGNMPRDTFDLFCGLIEKTIHASRADQVLQLF